MTIAAFFSIFSIILLTYYAVATRRTQDWVEGGVKRYLQENSQKKRKT